MTRRLNIWKQRKVVLSEWLNEWNRKMKIWRTAASREIEKQMESMNAWMNERMKWKRVGVVLSSLQLWFEFLSCVLDHTMCGLYFASVKRKPARKGSFHASCHFFLIKWVQLYLRLLANCPINFMVWNITPFPTECKQRSVLQLCTTSMTVICNPCRLLSVVGIKCW